MRWIFRAILRGFSTGAAVSALLIMSLVFVEAVFYGHGIYLYESNVVIAFVELTLTIAAAVVTLVSTLTRRLSI